MERLLAIPLKSSRITLYLHGGVLLLSILALWLCGLLVWIKLLLTAVLFVAALWQYQKQMPIRAIGIEQTQWWLLYREHKIFVELVNEQLVLSWLVVLNIREKESGKKHVLALWPDTASADDLRRLRVLLRNG